MKSNISRTRSGGGDLGVFGPSKDWCPSKEGPADFGGSEASGDAILAPRTHPGGPWEQQAGQEVAGHRI